MFVDLIFLLFKDSLAITLMLQPNDNSNNNNDKLDNDSNINLYAVDNMTCYLWYASFLLTNLLKHEVV